jgi:hypothetical protein
MARRILIVSEDLVEPWDEGIKKFAYSIGNALAPDHPVRMINVDRSGAWRPPAARATLMPIRVSGTRTFLSPRLPQYRRFNQAIVYVPSPSSTVVSCGRTCCAGTGRAPKSGWWR